MRRGLIAGLRLPLLQTKPTLYCTSSDGDLWPTCWSDDGSLYAANGVGKAFGTVGFDAGVSRIDGDPSNLTGQTLAGGDAIGQVWSDWLYSQAYRNAVCGKRHLSHSPRLKARFQ